MPWSSVPFPWWLWILTVLWAVAVFIWQRGLLPKDWQRGWGVVVVVYTALLVLVSAEGMTGWSLSRLMFWLAGGLALSGAFVLIVPHQAGGPRLGTWLASCGAAGMLVQLGAELVAGVVLALGGWLTWREASAASSSSSGGNPREAGLPPNDAWLIPVTVTVALVAWLGGVRHAVLVESQRRAPRPWETAIPATETVQQWVADGTGTLRASRSFTEAISWGEALALSAVLVWATYRLMPASVVGDSQTE
jgi:hypothetical protein